MLVSADFTGAVSDRDRAELSMSDPNDEHWAPIWSPEERESFFAAIARNRRASWQVGLAALLGAGVVATIVASLMAPLLYGIMGLTLDAINFLFPTPDLLALMFERLDVVIESLPDGTNADLPFPWADWLGFGFWAALPGLLLMSTVVLALHRGLRESTQLEDSGLRVREPQSSRLPEQRFVNVVGEMSIAALLPVPRVLITHRDAGNAVILEDDQGQPLIVVSMRLLDQLDRNAMQGVAAHLVSAIANDDMKNGHRVAVVMALFGLLARMATGFTDQNILKSITRLVLASLNPSARNARLLMAELADPFSGGDPQATNPEPDGKLTWKQWAFMPISGPVAMSGFFAGIVSSFLLSPVLALAWRRRKYLADATAVRLTRNPDAVARGLEGIKANRGADVLAPWAAHLAVVESATPRGTGATGFIDGAVLSFFPDQRKRLEALAAQGATVRLVEQKFPLVMWLVGLPLGAILVALFSTLIYLLMVVSLMLSMLFTLLPVAAIHALLR